MGPIRKPQPSDQGIWRLSALGVLSVFLAEIGFVIWLLTLSWQRSDRLIAIGDAVAVGAFLLAGLAAAVAIAAYRVSIRVPDLDVEISFPFSGRNHPVLFVDEWSPDAEQTMLSPDAWISVLKGDRPKITRIMGTVRIHNRFPVHSSQSRA